MGFQLSELTKPYVKVTVYPLQGKRRKEDIPLNTG
jgi:hypothetical protein